MLLRAVGEVFENLIFYDAKWQMVLYWITGANVNDGLETGTVDDVKAVLLDFVKKNPEK